MTSRSRVLAWAQRYASRHVNARGVVGPDFVVERDGPQLERWWLIPRNRWFNVYLHRFVKSDEDRALHDHMYVNLSWILGPGGYNEVMPVQGSAPWDPVRGLVRTWAAARSAGSLIVRWPTAAHRIVLPTDEPVWSLFITGPRVRHWGFWCAHGFRPWEEFVSQKPGSNSVGRGCD